MKCRQCNSVDRFKTKFKKIRQKLMICTVCGYHQIKGLNENNSLSTEEGQ